MDKKQVPGVQGISVDRDGNVYGSRGRRLKTRVNKKGYEVVSTHSGTYRVHRLVLSAFVGESELHCNHKDGVKTNNRLENLEYCTPSENMAHAYRLGLKKPTVHHLIGYHHRGRPGLSVLIYEASFHALLGMSQSAAGRRAGISQSVISRKLKLFTRSET